MENADIRKQTSFTRDELLRCGHGDVFGRENAKLPLPNMLMLDRITDIAPKGGRYNQGYVSAELDIDPSLWFFGCHFVGDPVMPGCLGLDAMWQLLGFFMTWSGHEGRGRALGVGEVRFRGQVLPENSTVTYQIDIRRILARKLVLGIADGTLSVDGNEIYFVKNMRVGLFTSVETFEEAAAKV